MVLLASLAAALGFVLPVLLFAGMRATRDREPWQMGLDIPFAVSLDLLVVLCLSLVFPLGTATLVSRAGYILVAIIVSTLRWRWGRQRPAWPATLGAHTLLRTALAASVALLISLWISRRFIIWDRAWHIPLVGSLGGQTLPFKNVFNASEVLHYHFSGDAHAAMLQALSLAVLHSSHALSLAHDIYFTLMGVFLALFLHWWGYRRAGHFLLAPAALLLTGPAHLFRDGIRTPQEGYSIVSFLSLSFRPHAGLSGLLILGFVGTVLARLGNRDELSWRKTAPALCACAAALAISDETDLGLLALALGVTWIYAPRVLHPRRIVGVAVFAGLLAALIVPNLLFRAALSPGAEHHTFAIVPWRSPGYYRESLPLTQARGRMVLILDLLCPVSVALGGLAIAWTRRARGVAILVGFFVTLLALSTVALTRIDFDGLATESHRFATAVMFLGPFVGIALLAKEFPAGSLPRPRWSKLKPYVTSLIAGGMAVPAFSTVDWGFSTVPIVGFKNAIFSPYEFNEISCRDLVGARTGDRTRQTYVGKSLYNMAAGCLPMFTPGYKAMSNWNGITIGFPYHTKDAVRAIRKAQPAGASIALLCPTRPDPHDEFCAMAKELKSCHRLGTAAMACMLTAQQAAVLSPP